MSKPLYQLTDEFQNIWEAILVAIEDGDGSIPPEMKAALDGVQSDITAKVENCCKVLKDLEWRADSCKAEEKRLEIRRKAAEAKIDWLESYVKQAMEATGKDKMEAGVFDLRIQKNPQAVNVTRESDIPFRYFATEVKKTLDKEGLRNDLKAGAVVPGAELTQGSRLVIR